MQKSITFLYTNNKYVEIAIKCTILFTIITEKSQNAVERNQRNPK